MTPEFLKSKAGKKFVEFDIPRLAEAVEKLAKLMEESNKIEEKKLFEQKKRILNERKEHARITRSSEDSSIA